MATKKFDSSNVNTKTGKMKPAAKAAASKRTATAAEKMAAPKPTAKANTGLQLGKGGVKPAAQPVKTATAKKAVSNTAVAREAITAKNKREAKAGL